ncbi:MAG: CPBP family intramembrane glutamic endopeptidase [Anaerolineae bacterium]
MGLIFTGAALIGVIMLANRLSALQNQRYYRIFDSFVLLAHLGMMLMGLSVWLAPSPQLASLSQNFGAESINLPLVGMLILGMAGWGILVSFRSFRLGLARWLPVNPDQPVHTLALLFSVYLTGNTLLTLTQGGLESLAANLESPTLVDVLLQLLLFLLLALFGVGWLTRRSGRALWQRLGVERPTQAQLQTGLRWILVLVIFQWAIGAVWALLAPEQVELVDGINITFLGSFDTLWEWLVLALATGVGEELLFRGALQPVLGIGYTSIIFAVAHVQYGLTPFTLVVLILSLVLGIIRRQSNTTVAIFVHSGYNFLLGLFTLLAATITP